MVWRVHRQKIILYCVMQLTGKAGDFAQYGEKSTYC